MTKGARTSAISTASTLCALLWLLFIRPAQAEVFFTPRTVLAAFFPSSQRVTYRRLNLSAEQAKKLGQRLGAPLPQTTYTFYIAQSGQTVDGYALLDEVMGQYMPISYALKFSPQGELQRLEIMVYRESYGSEVRDPRFHRQLVGKTAASPLKLGQDVVAISGATISSLALVLGARRALLLLDELLQQPAPLLP